MDAAIAGIVGAVGGAVVGALVTVGYNYYRDRREWKEKYQVMTFEKRLEVHQEALHWIYKLNKVLNGRNLTEVDKAAGEAREWWESKCLYLDKTSRHEMMYLINCVGGYVEHLRQPNLVKLPKVWIQLNTAKKAIETGIGMKHIEDVKEEKPEDES